MTGMPQRPHVEAPPLQIAEVERELGQLRRAETTILAIRWVVMAAWLPIFYWSPLPTSRSLVTAVHLAVLAYTALSHYLVRRSSAILATAMTTAVGDATAVFFMCLVTGGLESPIYPYFYLHILTTAIRFGGLRETLAALALDVGFTLVLFEAAPGAAASAGELALTVYYLALVAIIVGLLSRDAKTHYRRALVEGDKAGLLLSVNREITATLDLGELLQRIVREAANAIPCRGACILLLDAAGERAEQVVSAGGFPHPTAKEITESLESGLFRRATDDGTVVLEGVAAVARTVRCASVRTFVRRSLAVVAIRRRRVLGFLVMGDRTGAPRFEAEDIALLSAVADQAAVAIENARLMAEVSEARDKRQELLRQLIGVEEDERKRVAGEIHDRMGHRFFEFYYRIDQCREAFAAGSPDAAAKLDRLAEEARACADQIRELMNELRPSVLDDFGFIEALRETVASLSAEGDLEIALHVENGLRVRRPEVNVMLFRIFQEAVTNVRKHARAKHLDVCFGGDGNGHLELRVRDDGRGFDPRGVPRGHYGILYMRERAEACGGTLEVASRPGRGTDVRVSVPAG